jgi:hypothetical protein
MNEPDQTHEFTIYSRILRNSAPIPVVLAILLGVTPFLDVSIGAIHGLVKLAIWVLAGVLYVNNFLPSGEKVSYINVAFNAAILAGAADLLNEVVFWIVSAVQGINYNPIDGSAIATSFFQAVIIGGLVAIAWLFYKTNQKP